MLADQRALLQSLRAGLSLRILGSLHAVESAAEVESQLRVFGAILIKHGYHPYIHLHATGSCACGVISARAFLRRALEHGSSLVAAVVALQLQASLCDPFDIVHNLLAIRFENGRLWCVLATSAMRLLTVICRK